VDHAPGAPRYEGILNPAEYQSQQPQVQPVPQHRDQIPDKVALILFFSAYLASATHIAVMLLLFGTPSSM